MAKFTFDEAAIDNSITELDNTMYSVQQDAGELSRFWNTEMKEAISDDARADWDERFATAYKYCSTNLTEMIEQFKKVLQEAKMLYLEAKQRYLNEGKVAETNNRRDAELAAEQAKHPNGNY